MISPSNSNPLRFLERSDKALPPPVSVCRNVLPAEDFGSELLDLLAKDKSQSDTLLGNLRGTHVTYSSKFVSASVNFNSLIQMLRYSTSWPSHCSFRPPGMSVIPLPPSLPPSIPEFGPPQT